MASLRGIEDEKNSMSRSRSNLPRASHDRARIYFWRRESRIAFNRYAKFFVQPAQYPRREPRCLLNKKCGSCLHAAAKNPLLQPVYASSAKVRYSPLRIWVRFLAMSFFCVAVSFTSGNVCVCSRVSTSYSRRGIKTKLSSHNSVLGVDMVKHLCIYQ